MLLENAKLTWVFLHSISVVFCFWIFNILRHFWLVFVEIRKFLASLSKLKGFSFQIHLKLYYNHQIWHFDDPVCEYSIETNVHFKTANVMYTSTFAIIYLHKHGQLEFQTIDTRQINLMRMQLIWSGICDKIIVIYQSCACLWIMNRKKIREKNKSMQIKENTSIRSANY